MRERFIRVPKNKKAMEDYDFGILQNDQIVELVLSDEQYVLLDEIKVFEQINDQCDVIIDDYEEEVLSLEKIPIALEVINSISNKTKNEDLTNLKEMLELALRYKTLVGFDF